MTTAEWAALFLCIVLSALVMRPAKAHSWFDLSCCSDRDCERLAPEQVTITPQGYVLPNGQTVPFGQERTSVDRDYYWCRYPGTKPLVHPANEKPCFYAPSTGS